jgi:hypothetical protein
MDPVEGSITSPIVLGNTERSLDVYGLTPGRPFIFSLLAQSVDPVTNETFDSSLTLDEERTCKFPIPFPTKNTSLSPHKPV